MTLSGPSLNAALIFDPPTPGMLDPQVAGERHGERALATGLDVQHHHRVGPLTAVVLLVAERLLLRVVVDERAGVRADQEVVGAFGRCVGNGDVDPVDRVELLVDDVVDRDDRARP